MKRALVFSLILMVGIVGVAQAGHGNVGLGIQLGEPTGITAKFWLDRTSALDVTLGWDIIHDHVTLQGGYLYHFPLIVRTGDLYAYVGVGGKLGIWGDDVRDDSDVRLYGRIPLGLDFIYDPISFYAELDPLIELIPTTDFDIGGGIGFRFYF